MPDECRPPEGTKDGAICVLTNGGPHPMLISRIWDARRDRWDPLNPLHFSTDTCLTMAAHGWRFHSLAEVPHD